MVCEWQVTDPSCDDFDELALLVFESAPEPLTACFSPNSAAQTLAFLRYAFATQAGQYGYQNHKVVRDQNKVIGVACAWHSELPKDFDKQTLKTLHGFFGLTQSMDILARNAVLAKQTVPPEANDLIIGHISVDPDFRRLGVASTLVAHFLAHATSLGKQRVIIDVNRHNSLALKCYQNLGFKQTNNIASEYFRLCREL